MRRRSFGASEAGPLVEQVMRGAQVDGATARALLERGAVYVAGRRAVRDGPVAPGARIMVVLEEPTVAHGPPAAVEVLVEDAQVLVVNKPAGVPTQATPGQVQFTMLAAATAHLGAPAHLVHRLDRDTSGVLVFARTRAAAAELAAAFRERHVVKTYEAITGEGIGAAGDIELPLSRDPSHVGRWRASRAANGVPAHTTYRRVSARGPHALVELTPHTGRTHQLRAHLAAIGWPIVGDRLYGGAPGPRCLLHAARLEILGRTLVAPRPADFAPYV